ncbi:MAG: cupin domain-containing protein [Solirubrobacterales bacterium]
MRPRRVVTGHDAEGRPRIVGDDPLPRFVERAAIPGMADGVVWATPAVPGGPFDGADPTPGLSPLLPPAGETRFNTVTFPPDSVFAAADFDPAAAAAENAAVIPELTPLMDPENPGMHRTPTVDYVIVLEGEVVLEMEGGEEAVLRQGDFVIQNATRHAWRNRSERPATLAVVMIGIAAGPRSHFRSDSEQNCERAEGAR